jgi:hypothetical protein
MQLICFCSYLIFFKMAYIYNTTEKIKYKETLIGSIRISHLIN